MGLSDGTARVTPEFNQPDLVEAIVKGYYGEDGYVDGIEAVKDDSFKNERDLADKDLMGTVFDLSGRRMAVNHNADSPKTLPKGVYVIKGRKVIVQ